MARVIAFDLIRLFLGPIFPAPRGIDRVDLALARNLFADPASPNLGILPSPWGIRAYPARVVRQGLDYLQELWAEASEIGGDPVLENLVARLHNPDPTAIGPGGPPNRFPLARRARRLIDLVRRTGFHRGRSVDSVVPQGAIYLNVGQLGLAVPLFTNWLDRRPDVTSAIMLHDVIPLDHPELVMPGSAAHHARMVQTAARRADCMIFNTNFAETGIRSALARVGRFRLPRLVRSLPLPEAFVEARSSLPVLADTHYFVSIATIEPRKNVELLLRVWQRIVARLGDSAPHLVVVGSQGYDASRILARLSADPVLCRRVHHVEGLSSPALAALVLGAAGMLCPSLAEGFGLPVMEGNAMGVPTIASDIPAHREIAGTGTVLLAPDDSDGWEREVSALRKPGLRQRPPIARQLTETAYCEDLIDFVERCAGDR